LFIFLFGKMVIKTKAQPPPSPVYGPHQHRETGRETPPPPRDSDPSPLQSLLSKGADVNVLILTGGAPGNDCGNAQYWPLPPPSYQFTLTVTQTKVRHIHYITIYISDKLIY